MSASEIKSLIEAAQAPTASNDTKSRLIGSLLNHSSDPEKQEWISEYGGLQVFVQYLDSEKYPDNLVLRACGALLNCSTTDANRAQISQFPDAVPAICKLLSHANDNVAQYAAGALNNLAAEPSVAPKVIESDGLQRLVQLLQKALIKNDTTTLQYTMGALAAISSDESCAIELATKLNAVKLVTHLITEEGVDPEVMQRGSGCLWNMAVSDDSKPFFNDRSIVEKIFSLFDCGYSEVIANACVVIAGIAALDEIGQMIGEMGGLERIIQLLGYQDELELQTNVAMALWNLANNEENRNVIRESGALEPLFALLDCGMVDALEKVTGAIYAQSIDTDSAAMFRQMGAFEKLIPLLTVDESVDMLVNVASAIAVLSYPEEAKVEVLEAGGIDNLLHVMQSYNHDELLEKAAGALLNLSLSKKVQTTLRENGGIQLLVQLLDKEDVCQEAKENIAGALWNLSADNKNKMLIKKLGGLKKLLTIIAGGSGRGENQSTEDEETELEPEELEPEELTFELDQPKTTSSQQALTKSGRSKKTTLADSDDESELASISAPRPKISKRPVKKSTKLAGDSDDEDEAPAPAPAKPQSTGPPRRAAAKLDSEESQPVKSAVSSSRPRRATQKTKLENDEVSDMINKIDDADDADESKVIEAFDKLKKELDVDNDFIGKKVNNMRKGGPPARGRGGKVQKLED